MLLSASILVFIVGRQLYILTAPTDRFFAWTIKSPVMAVLLVRQLGVPDADPAASGDFARLDSRCVDRSPSNHATAWPRALAYPRVIRFPREIVWNWPGVWFYVLFMASILGVGLYGWHESTHATRLSDDLASQPTAA